MQYKDQLVLTGQINDVGAPVMTNVPESYRAGIELLAGIGCLLSLSWHLILRLVKTGLKILPNMLITGITGMILKMNHCR
jgi:hypothetical protein